MNTATLTTLAETEDPRLLRNAFACFPSGVTSVCAMVDGQPVGMAASSFTSVSITPALVSVCVDNGSSTWPKLQGAARIGVSVLGEDHDKVCRQLASRDASARFTGLDISASDDGAVFVDEAPLWLECSIFQEIPAGDHVIVLLKIEALLVQSNVHPLVFHGSTFRQLQKLAG